MKKVQFDVVNIFSALAILFLGLIIFSGAMVKELGHDEQMYCSGGVLMAQWKMIYRDFSYVAQMPYHPLICAMVYKMFNTTYYLLTGRIISAICDIMSVLCIIAIFRNAFGKNSRLGTSNPRFECEVAS